MYKILFTFLLVSCAPLGFTSILNHECPECNDQPSGTPAPDVPLDIPLTHCFEQPNDCK
jgi:hypothetical protein